MKKLITISLLAALGMMPLLAGHPASDKLIAQALKYWGVFSEKKLKNMLEKE
jgi:hypothetical protein